MSLLNTIGAPINVNINGVDYELPLLTIGDWAKIQTAWKSYNAQNMNETIKSLVSTGFNLTLVPALVRDLNKTCTIDEMFSFVSTPAGAVEVLYISFQKSKTPKTKAEIENMLGLEPLIEIAIRILCLEDPSSKSEDVAAKKD